MSNPTTDNKALEVINGLISALMAGGEAAAEAYLVALEPEIMALPVVGWIIDQGVHYLAMIVSVAGQKMVDNFVLDIQTNGETSNVITATTALAIAQASGDINAINQAVKVASESYKAAFNLDGWAHPS